MCPLMGYAYFSFEYIQALLATYYVYSSPSVHIVYVYLRPTLNVLFWRLSSCFYTSSFLYKGGTPFSYSQVPGLGWLTWHPPIKAESKVTQQRLLLAQLLQLAPSSRPAIPCTQLQSVLGPILLSNLLSKLPFFSFLCIVKVFCIVWLVSICMSTFAIQILECLFGQCESPLCLDSVKVHSHQIKLEWAIQNCWALGAGYISLPSSWAKLYHGLTFTPRSQEARTASI